MKHSKHSKSWFVHRSYGFGAINSCSINYSRKCGVTMKYRSTYPTSLSTTNRRRTDGTQTSWLNITARLDITLRGGLDSTSSNKPESHL